MMALIDALEAREGIVCAVGAGGKKSVLYQLAREHPGRVALTATVHITEFPDDLDLDPVIGEEPNLQARVLAADRGRCVAYACPSSKPGRHAGVSPAAILAIHDAGAFAATYVKADGARMRWIKAPGANEPILVPAADTVVPVVSARSIGEPLSERVAHRVDRVAAVTGIAPGEMLTPEAVGRLLTSDQGALQHADKARVAPVINMVDNKNKEEMARAAANAAIAMTSRFDRVVLCCLRRPDRPVVTVVTR